MRRAPTAMTSNVDHQAAIDQSAKPALAGSYPASIRWAAYAWCVFLVGVLLIAGFNAIGVARWLANSPTRQAPNDLDHEDRQGTSRRGSGDWAGFHYTFRTEDGRTVVTFRPFLPRDNETVVNAVRAVASTVYGEDLSRAEPSLERQNGITTIVLSQDYTTVWVVLLKDAGEVHSVSMTMDWSMRPKVF